MVSKNNRLPEGLSNLTANDQIKDKNEVKMH
jgi:hypothetical protein